MRLVFEDQGSEERRIDDERRPVYLVTANEIVIFAVRYHY